MRALVVYESMYGNTHNVADHIAAGLAGHFDVEVVTVADATDKVRAIDLLVVGAPTHIHGMPSKMSHKAAVDALEKDPDLTLDENLDDDTLRDWFDEMEHIDGGTAAAAFDTRIDASPILTGRASRGIARRLRRHGFRLVAPPESFLVDKHNHVVAGETDRARSWGESLAAAVAMPTA
jgi:hypothetical protein